MKPPPTHKLDEEAVRAAEAFLRGRTGVPDSSGSAARGQAPPAESAESTSPFAASTATASDEPARLELSAPDIRRGAAGWRARCIHKRGVDSRHVTDARYGGYVRSFIAAVDARDRFYRERGMPIPWQIEAIVDGERVAPEVVHKGRSIIVRFQGQEHEVTGDDAEEIATEIALDVFVEYLDTFGPQAPGT